MWHCKFAVTLLCCAAEGGEEAFTSEMVASAAQTIRHLCAGKPDESKVIICSCALSDLFGFDVLGPRGHASFSHVLQAVQLACRVAVSMT